MSNVLRRVVLVVATILTALLLTPATAAAQCTGGLANTLGVPGNDLCGGVHPAIGSGVAVAAALGAAAIHATVMYAQGAAATPVAQPSLSTAGLARSAGRVGAVRDVFDMFDLSRAIAIYDALGDTPRKVRIDRNDNIYEDAHTLDHHGADMPLNQNDAPGKRTIEGRIHGDKPWKGKESWSFRWKDHATMNRTVNDYIQANWELIRNDLARFGNHQAIFDTGQLAGEGFANESWYEPLPRKSFYAQTSHVRIALKLDPDDISSFYVFTAYPAKIAPDP